MDDTVTYSLLLDAEGNLPVRPKLVIACSTGNLRVYVDTQTLLTQDPLFEEIGWYSRGRYRFDQEKAQEMSWHTSEDHHTIFVPEETVGPSNERHQFSVEFLDQLAGAQAFRLEYSPLNGQPAVAEFDVRGLRNHLDQLKTQCPW
jgi:hypothetical protein